MASFATVAEYYASQGKVLPDPLPEDVRISVEALLEDASDAVRSYTITGVYPVDADGNATDPAHIHALMRATCKQARYYELNPAARDELVRKYDSIRAGSFSLSTNAGSNAGSGAGAALTDWRSPAAIAILKTAGLIRARTSTTRGR